jgi:hypothetical protein
MNRRSLMGLFITPTLLTGCGNYQSVTRRFRVIATFEVDGKNIEASTVMQFTVSRALFSLLGQGGSDSLVGEAIIADLPGRNTVYVLPSASKTLQTNYYVSIYRSIGINRGIGGWEDADYDRLRTVNGRFHLNNDTPPAIISFADEKIPRTVYEIDPRNMSLTVPGVRFKGIIIEFTEAPVTKVLAKRLPWVTGPDQFDRDPPGHIRPDRERPLPFLISNINFFGTGR